MILDRAYKKMQRAVLESTGHFDANETMFLERELTQLRARIYTVEYAPSIARSFVPKASDIAASADTYSFKVFKPVGEAELIAYKSGAIPRVDLTGDEVLGKVRPLAAAYGWDINELREAARLGTQLSEVKARTAREAIERAIDNVLAYGTTADKSGNMPDVGLNGLVNNTLVEALSVLAGGWWLNPTPLDPDIILKNLSDLVIASSNASYNIFAADTLLLPLTHYNYIAQTPFSSLTGESILSTFRKNNPSITMIAPWWKLNSVSTAQGGDAGKPRAIAYKRDPMVLEAVIPQEFEQMPPQMQGLEFLINCHARCGGVKIYQPLGVKYMDFATA